MPAVAKVACVYNVLETISGAWTFHVIRGPGDDPWDTSELGLLCDAVYRYWAGPVPEFSDGPEIRGRYENTLALIQIEAYAVQPYSSDFYVLPVHELGTAIAVGDRPAQLMPPQLAELIGLRTALDSRRGKGRIYMPARKAFTVVVDSTEQEEGRLTPGRQEELAEQGAVLHTCIQEASHDGWIWNLGVYSRVAGTAHTVTHFAIPDHYATQRRRRSPAIQYRRWDVDMDPLE